MSLTEAIAEKVRAALTRINPAIRDIFDLWHAQKEGALPISDPTFVQLVRQKLAVPGNRQPEFGKERYEEFRKQVSSDLFPVLRSSDYDQFDFEAGWKIIEDLWKRIETYPSAKSLGSAL